jgi:hypothetical protein
MIFAEYIARDRSIALEIFRHLGHQDWASDEDERVLNIGRTMKIGPEPHYMCWWRIKSMVRMDGWEDYFRTAEGRRYAQSSPVPRAMNFYRCGLYDEIIGQGQLPGGLHLVEFFAGDEAPGAELADWFRERAHANGAGRLGHVIRRIGLAGPEPGGMAVWTFQTYVEVEPFLRQRPRGGPAKLVELGFYRNFGEDIA